MQSLETKNALKKARAGASTVRFEPGIRRKIRKGCELLEKRDRFGRRVTMLDYLTYLVNEFSDLNGIK